MAEGLPADEELAEDQDLDDMYTLEELFKELESGDPVKAGKLILQKKKLFVPMRKHFQVENLRKLINQLSVRSLLASYLGHI